MYEEMYGGWSRERFTGGSISEIESLLTENPTERHNLEYKAAGWENNHELCQQVTSFANSAGGILVWGVKEKPAPPSTDPIATAVDKQRLTDILSSSVSPPLDFEHFDAQPVPAPGGGSVYVLYVPQSPRAPHMVTSKGVHYGKYHKRGIEGCVVMLDYEVRDVMGRRQRPDLELVLGQSTHSRQSQGLDVWASFLLHNRGGAAARYAAVAFAAERQRWLGPPHASELRRGWSEVPMEFGAPMQVMHLENPVFPHLPVRLRWGRRIDPQAAPQGTSDTVAFRAQSTIYCEAAEPKRQRFLVQVPRSPANWDDKTMTGIRELRDDEYDAASELLGLDADGSMPPR